MPRSIDDAFDEFEGGITAPEISQHDEQHIIAQKQMSDLITTIDGKPIGDVVGRTFEVKIQQLELAPASDLLYSQFRLHDPDDNSDPQIHQYAKSVEGMGILAPALMVLPLPRTIVINGESLPMFRVYHDPYVYEAYVRLHRARVPVIMPPVDHPGAILLMALSVQQHTRKPSMLERCDTARRLAETYGIDQNVIALHLARDSETGEAPSRSYVSRLISISNLPGSVRDLLHSGLITLSHAVELLPVRQDETLCIQLANWVCDGNRKSVRMLADLVKDLQPGAGIQPQARLIERDGHIQVERSTGRNETIKLVGEPVRPFVTYDRTIAVKPIAIRREMSRFTNVEVVPHQNPDQIDLTQDSFEQLRQWVVGRQGQTTVRETEAVLLGFLEAVRSQAAQTGVLNAQGILSAVVDVDANARQA